MSVPPASVWIRRAVIAALAASGLLLSWAWERQSVERANRLYRDGATNEAAALYGERLTEAEEISWQERA